MAPGAQPVVFDLNILIDAVTSGRDDFMGWPSPPPTSGHGAADCVGIIDDAQEFSLWLSPYILTNVERVLVASAEAGGYEWASDRVKEYLETLVEVAEASGGGVVEPNVTVTDCPDYEDNRILEATLASGALLIVANDSDLVRMSPWKDTPIIPAREFAG